MLKNPDRLALSIVATICISLVAAWGIGAKARVESHRIKTQCVKYYMDAGKSIEDSRRACRK